PQRVARAVAAAGGPDATALPGGAGPPGRPCRCPRRRAGGRRHRLGGRGDDDPGPRHRHAL
ncbi:MAG: Phenazine biosynthesis protein PhzF like, partial [uncultured Friedmanniella sp.]